MLDREIIATQVRQLKSKEDVLDLLNKIKQSDTENWGVAMSYPFTKKHLNFYCNPKYTNQRYRQFSIKKKSGGYRIITTPQTKTYKLLLRYLNEIFKSLYTASDYAMGFSEGRSVVSNAQQHVGHNYVFNMDLKDFFTSIDKSRVWKRLQLPPFDFNSDVAHLIAGLCSVKGERLRDGKVEEAIFLPQGAPTSPIITNMICDRLDHRLAGLARRFGLTYTRYADDITFSSQHNVYQRNGEFMTELRRIIIDQHFVINEDKTRLQKIGSRQEVTGIILSNKINVTQKYIRNIRNILYIWEKYGFVAANNNFLVNYSASKGHVKKGNPDMVNVLDGKLLYLKMVRGEEDSVYKRLYDQYQRLAGTMHSGIMVSKSGVEYLNTISIAGFEKVTNSEVVFMSEGNHRWVEFFLADQHRVASIRKDVLSTSPVDKTQLSMSLCRDKNKNEFWLVHNTPNAKPQKSLDIMVLNQDLDKLLGLLENG